METPTPAPTPAPSPAPGQQPAPTPTPSPTPATPTSKLLDQLPAQYRGQEAFTKYVDPATGDLSLEKFAQGYDHLARLAGAPADQILRLPKADDAAGWGDVYNRLGRPATPDAYQFNGIDLTNAPDKAFVEGFRGEAHKLGFSQTQMDGVMGYLASSIATVDQQLAAETAAQRTAAQAELAKAWGDKAQVYQTEIPLMVERLGVKAGLIQPGDAAGKDALIKALNVGGEADNPALMRLLGVMCDMTAEGGNLPGAGRGAVQPGAMTPEQAAIALDAFNANKDKFAALHDRRNPGHNAAKAEWQQLIEAKAAGQAGT